MQPESLRSVAQRLENYFEWYFRIDPDATAWAVTLVSRFNKLVSGTGDALEAKKLLDDTSGVSLGSPWEEMRLALLTLATR
ncbi:MAG: hypothetical protein JNM17_25330 [Archangium sp.]|nr:hypothetical protein [Archangium sp.]